jgi:tetratricopeptide (TPR) repeat protein
LAEVARPGYRARVSQTRDRTARGLITRHAVWLALALVVAHTVAGGSARAQTASGRDDVSAASPAKVRPAATKPARTPQLQPSPSKEALDHFALGRRAYLDGRYRDALAELKSALRHDSDAPDLLYNVARVYENLREFDQAIVYYQRYLGHLPTAANAAEREERERTLKTIRRLQGAKHEDPREPSRGRADLVFWLSASGAVALFAGGAALGMLALDRKQDVAGFVLGVDGSLARRDTLSRQTKTLGAVADGLFIAGGVALTGAALLYFLRERSERAPAASPSAPHASALRLHLSVDTIHAQVAVSGHF